MVDNIHEDLDKIDELRHRLRIGYAEAKALLDEHNSDVISALIASENTGKTGCRTKAINDFVDKTVEIIQKGNENQVVVNRRGEEVFKVPANLAIITGAVGLAVYPFVTALLVGAAWYTDWRVKVEKTE